MREFVTTVKQTFQVSWQELIAFNLIALGGGVCGIIVALILMGTGALEGEYATIGATIAIIIGMIIMIFVGIFSLQQDFNLAISLGKTRKHYVPARFLLSATNCLLCLVTVLIIGWVENVLYTAIYPGAVCAFRIDSFLTHPAAIVGFVLLVPMIILFCSAFIVKFGMKFSWAFWVLWMLGCTVLPRMFTAAIEEPDSFLGKAGAAMLDFFAKITAAQAMIGMVAVSMLGMIAAFMLLRRQRVTL